jgi:hypothetical protein
MADASCNPYVRAALPTLNAVANSAGLTARLRERFGEYAEIAWQDATVSKAIVVTATREAFRVAVDALAREVLDRRTGGRRAAPWCSRAFGTVNLRDHGSEEVLEGLLAEALSYLRAIDLADLRHEYEQMLEHVTQRLRPALEGFAAARGGRVETQYLARSFRFLLTWPGRDPRYQLSVHASPQRGASVTYSVQARGGRGVLRHRQWVGPGFKEISPGIFQDSDPAVRIDSWTDVQGLRDALEESARHAEALLRKQEEG